MAALGLMRNLKKRSVDAMESVLLDTTAVSRIFGLTKRENCCYYRNRIKDIHNLSEGDIVGNKTLKEIVIDEILNLTEEQAELLLALLTREAAS